MRRVAVVLCLMSLFDQLGATCTARGHASLFSSMIPYASMIGSETITPCHGSCCHAGDPAQETPDPEESGPTAPFHLCSATHAVFIAPTLVVMPELAHPSHAWLDPHAAIAFRLPTAPSTTKAVESEAMAAVGAPARAKLQVFQI